MNVDKNEHDKLLMENVFASCMTTFSTDLESEHSLTKQSISNHGYSVKEYIPVFLVTNEKLWAHINKSQLFSIWNQS